MKKVFTLVLAMALVVTGFAQIKSSFKKQAKPVPAQMVTLTGFEERDMLDFPASTRNIVTEQEAVELSQTYYDWQSNAAARNFTAVWPDGYAVMCYTQATDEGYSDRGTGLSIWDPEVGEWEYTEQRVEDVKTGFGSIARYKENGLVVAAHTATDCRIFIVEDFKDGHNRDFGQGIAIPTDGDEGRIQDPSWPVVQCSGENLDIIHIIATEYSLTEPMGSALLYTRYENGEFTVHNHIIPNVDASHMSDGGSNICYFMPYDPQRPNRVSFILNNAWSDCKLVISEDNGETWNERVFYQHPGINVTYEDSFFYPRWVTAAFDGDDNLHIAYEWNGTTGEAGSGSYYPTLGGIGYWSEILPKNEMCLGGIGNVGEPFIMDTAYLQSDLYYSEWYWGDALHEPLPEYIGELEILDAATHQVWPDHETSPENYLWVDLDAKDHGAYNSGITCMPSMCYDVAHNKIVVAWSSICGHTLTEYYDASASLSKYTLFCNYSTDGGRTWEGTKHIITQPATRLWESAYGQVIPYVYNDADGDYVWYVFQQDLEAGTYVQDDDPVADNNQYDAIKIYLNDLLADVEENNVEVLTTMTVYPNPANGSFFMDLNQESDVNIYNVAGQLVKTYNSVKSLNVNLEAGIYFVKAGNETQKVVVF